MVLAHITVVFLPLYLATIHPSGWRLLFYSLWFGVGMNGLLNLLHECSHLHVFKKQAGSIFLGRWVLGPLVLADFDGYQKRHWDHHRKIGTEDDPKYVYRVSIRGNRFVGLVLRCLFLAEAVKKFSVQVPSKNETKISGGFWRSWVVKTLGMQALLFTSVYLTALAAAPQNIFLALQNALTTYAVVYGYGLAAITLLVSSLRAIAEHQIGGDNALVEGNAALRNFSFGCFSGFLLGAYGFKDHASHHRDPGIPYYRLEAKTRELVSENKAFSPKTPYEKILLSLILP